MSDKAWWEKPWHFNGHNIVLGDPNKHWPNVVCEVAPGCTESGRNISELGQHIVDLHNAQLAAGESK